MSDKSTLWMKWLPWVIVAVFFTCLLLVMILSQGKIRALELESRAVQDQFSVAKDTVLRLSEKENAQGAAVQDEMEALRQKYLRVTADNQKLEAEIASWQIKLENTGKEKVTVDVEKETQAIIAVLAEKDQLEKKLKEQSAQWAKETKRQQASLEVLKIRYDFLKKKLETYRKEKKEGAQVVTEAQSKLQQTQQQALDAQKELTRLRAQRVLDQKKVADLEGRLKKATPPAPPEEKKTPSGAKPKPAAPDNNITQRAAAIAHYNLGVSYARQGLYKEAVAEFEYAVSLDNSDGLAHYNLALVQDLYLKNAKAAIPHYEAYIRLMPKATDAQEVQKKLYHLKISQEITAGRDLRREIA